MPDSAQPRRHSSTLFDFLFFLCFRFPSWLVEMLSSSGSPTAQIGDPLLSFFTGCQLTGWMKNRLAINQFRFWNRMIGSTDVFRHFLSNHHIIFITQPEPITVKELCGLGRRMSNTLIPTNLTGNYIIILRNVS